MNRATIPLTVESAAHKPETRMNKVEATRSKEAISTLPVFKETQPQQLDSRGIIHKSENSPWFTKVLNYEAEKGYLL